MSSEIENLDLVYKVEERRGKFEISTSSGRTILIFRDLNSASQYATLLNAAFKNGYKLGYRAGLKH